MDNHLVFLTDKLSQQKFLLDTGSQKSIYFHPTLHGQISLKLNFTHLGNFTWSFELQNVSQPILGIDFLTHLIQPLNKISNDR